MNKKSNLNNSELIANLSEDLRLELLNLAVMFRSQMIAKDEFLDKAEGMGVLASPETILQEFQLTN